MSNVEDGPTPLPREVFVKYRTTPGSAQSLVVKTSPEQFVSMFDDERRIGRYVLVDEMYVTTRVEVTKISSGQ